MKIRITKTEGALPLTTVELFKYELGVFTLQHDRFFQ